MLQVYDRARGELYEEEQFGGNALAFLYGNRLGRILLYGIAARPLYAKIHARRMQGKASLRLIPSFIEKYDIAVDDFEHRYYRSFADFFERKFVPGVRPVAPEPGLAAPADARLIAWPVADEGKIRIKGLTYTLTELLQDHDLAEKFRGGTCLVYRLTVADGHRYIQITDGEIIQQKEIAGRLHTVSHFSSKVKTLAENKRVFCVQRSGTGREWITMEVGAMQVGTIHNAAGQSFRRGQEKGYFSLGGSTIVQIFAAGQILLDPDIREYSGKGIEVKVLQGQHVGEWRI